MGMFDDIRDVPEQKCRGCGEPIAGWQSKDGECVLSSIPYWRVHRFYAGCRACGMWHEFVERATMLPQFRPLSDYELLIRGKDDAWDSLRRADPTASAPEVPK